MRGIAAAAMIVALCSLAACPDSDSMSPIRRTTSGYTILELNASYSPRGRTGTTIGNFGDFYQYTTLFEETHLSLTGIVDSGRSSRFGFSLTAISWRAKEERVYMAGSQTISSSGIRSVSSGFFEQSLLPNHTLDPRFRITFTSPRSAGISMSASYILDPVVLAGKAEYSVSSEAQTHWLAATGSIGFVANPRLSLVAIGYLGVPIKGIDLPVASIGLRARMARDYERLRELDVEFAWVLIGETPYILIELCVRRRYPESRE